SCFMLGNNAYDTYSIFGSGNFGGGYVIPSGTIVPAAGFCVIRGVNAPAVPPARLVQNGGNTIELIVTQSNVCIEGNGTRLWFPDAGSWFAFYDANGVPQDAVSWGDAPTTNLNLSPCIP